jgi:pimeloyl-ACP methyl ester carboxylesterase
MAAPPSSTSTGPGTAAPGRRATSFEPPSHRRGLPEGLHVVERPPAGGWEGYEGPVVVLVHGALDRAGSFARVARRLPEWAIVAYDRRGYQSSRRAGVARDLWTHADDLLRIASAYGDAGRPVTAVGHSIGGTVVLAAAVRTPAPLASVGAYEPSVPWLGFRGARPGDRRTGRGDAGEEAARFFRRIVGDGAWERLPAAARASRVADGPALVADLASTGGAAPFDVTSLATPALFAVGGAASAAHHQQSVRWLARHVPGASEARVPDAGHGAHLSHPDAFAALVREAVALAHRPAGAR